jgi:hypothetical protein
MLALKYFLMILGLGLFGSTGALLAYDIYVSEQLRKLVTGGRRKEPAAKFKVMVHGVIGTARRRAA